MTTTKRKKNQAKLISILVPVYNEEATIDAFMKRVDSVIEQIKREFKLDVELIFTDNASEDNTYAKIQEHAVKRENIKIYRFSKNVGFQRSIISGYAFAKGAACVQIDCDLEDPPELIIDFIKKWQEGYKVVYGRRRRRSENWVLKSLRTVFYNIVNHLSEVDIPLHAGDFRLIDRRIIDIVCQVNDAEPYLRGLIANLGFEQVGVTYDRSFRVAGTSSFNLRSYTSLAIEGILQSSIKPLNYALILASIVFACSMLLATFYIVTTLNGTLHSDIQGFASLAVLSLFQFSFLLLVIGINSLYLGRVYRQVFRRPISIMDETNAHINADENQLTYWPSKPYDLEEDKPPLQNKRNRNKTNTS